MEELLKTIVIVLGIVFIVSLICAMIQLRWERKVMGEFFEKSKELLMKGGEEHGSKNRNSSGSKS